MKLGFNNLALFFKIQRDKKKTYLYHSPKPVMPVLNDRFLYKKTYKIAEKTYRYKHKMKIRNAFKYSGGEDLKKKVKEMLL